MKISYEVRSTIEIMLEQSKLLPKSEVIGWASWKLVKKCLLLVWRQVFNIIIKVLRNISSLFTSIRVNRIRKPWNSITLPAKVQNLLVNSEIKISAQLFWKSYCKESFKILLPRSLLRFFLHPSQCLNRPVHRRPECHIQQQRLQIPGIPDIFNDRHRAHRPVKAQGAGTQNHAHTRGRQIEKS